MSVCPLGIKCHSRHCGFLLRGERHQRRHFATLEQLQQTVASNPEFFGGSCPTFQQMIRQGRSFDLSQSRKPPQVKMGLNQQVAVNGKVKLASTYQPKAVSYAAALQSEPRRAPRQHHGTISQRPESDQTDNFTERLCRMESTMALLLAGMPRPTTASPDATA